MTRYEHDQPLRSSFILPSPSRHSTHKIPERSPTSFISSASFDPPASFELISSGVDESEIWAACSTFKFSDEIPVLVAYRLVCTRLRGPCGAERTQIGRRDCLNGAREHERAKNMEGIEDVLSRRVTSLIHIPNIRVLLGLLK